MLLLYIFTVFVSALLLFLIQPLFANMVLPLLGGSPAVWNTATLFYQLVLLAGYIYAHVIKSRLSPKAQAILHSVVVLSPLVALPIAIPAGWVPPTDSTPILWLMALLLVSVGLPFFVLSTTSSLIQTWFARAPHKAARDPYFLYAASNTGSMLGLLLFPLVLQPTFVLQTQSGLWSVGYGGLTILLLACTWLAWHKTRSTHLMTPQTPSPTPQPAEPLAWSRRLRWVLLAFVPSSLMLSVTTYISTDIAAVPLLWVIPLALYLLTFILVFAKKQWIAPGAATLAMQICLVVLAVLMITKLPISIVPVLFIHLLTFFLIAFVCHGLLAKDRPSPSRLTEFYLWMSLGGALGGTFNALIAPVVFTSVVEYPVVLVLACLLLVTRQQFASRRALWGDGIFALALAGFISLGIIVAAGAQFVSFLTAFAFVLAIAGFVSLLFARRPLRFAIGLAALFFIGLTLMSNASQSLVTKRSFFGINRVNYNAQTNANVLVHGTTIHGSQKLAANAQCQPLDYYHRRGPVGQVFEVNDAHWAHAKIGAVGLGAGELAGYAQPGQAWTFFEIDPDVQAIATNPAYFTFLQKCAPQATVVLGDARLMLKQQPQAAYDFLIMDAYSSDAIPLHLITRESLALYRSRLTSHGLLAFHITNRFFDLEPILANLAADAGWVGAIRKDQTLTPEDVAASKAKSTWVVLAPGADELAALLQDGRWTALTPNPNKPLWTDNFASLLSVIREVIPAAR